MSVTLRYFDGCPNWRTTYERLRDVLREEGMTDIEPILERIETDEDAERLQFVGSPTVLIDGRDPFAGREATFGLACRVYQTPDGLAGSPTLEQLREVIHTA